MMDDYEKTVPLGLDMTMDEVGMSERFLLNWRVICLWERKVFEAGVRRLPALVRFQRSPLMTASV